MAVVQPIRLGEEQELLEQIKLNRQAQHELVAISENLDQVRQGLLENATNASKELSLAQQAYVSIPTRDNLSLLDEARANEVRAINNLDEFEKSTKPPNEPHKLREREKQLIETLIQVRRQKGVGSLASEREQLKKKLGKLLPRFIALTCELDHIAPGLISIEKSLCHQIPELKSSYAMEFKTIQDKLREV